MKITSLQNPKVKYWTSLKNKKIRDNDQCFLIEGDHLVNEAKKYNLIKEIISTQDETADYFVTEDIMQKISNQVSISSLAAVVKFIPTQDISGNILVLDGIQDPGNLGTMIRSSLAFNFKTIILGENCVDLYNAKVIRATEGMLFHQNILRKNLRVFLPTLKENGYTLIGTDVQNGKNIKEFKGKKIALIIGSEGQGISPEVKPLCDMMVYIKMNKQVESLNASVAAAILMYEVNSE